MYEYTASFV